MRVKALRIFVHVLLFGLLLGASSTAYADTVVITSFTFGIQVVPATGTVAFTPTAASVRAGAMNSLGQNQDITSNTVPLAQTSAMVTFANAAGTANAANQTATANASVSVGGCACTASAFVLASFDTTFVIQGGDGNVNVTLLPMPFASGQVTTDQFGQFAFSMISWKVTLNGVVVFFTDEMLRELTGPNQTGGFQLTPGLLSRTFTLQNGATNTLRVDISAGAAGVSSVPEPATVVLLISGLGFMTGVIKKRRNKT